MKNYILILISLFTFTFFTSCDRFDEFNTNPNATTKVTSAMLSTGMLLNMTKQDGSKAFITNQLVSKHLAWAELTESAQYNKFERSGFWVYSSLVNINKMVEYASTSGNSAYEALGLFIKAYNLFYLSIGLGDIPYSESLNGESGNVLPKYDSQKEVMMQILSDLEKSELLFSQAKDFDGDPILMGNVVKWRRTVNAFRLKVLINLSKKETDTDLNIKNKFAQIVAAGNLMQTNDDNFQLVYSDKAGQIYPFNTVNSKFPVYGVVSGTIVDTMKVYGDYRLFYYASPAKAQVDQGISADDFNAYLGVNPADVFSDLKTLYTQGKYCAYNPRYTQYAPGEPVVRIGYAEQCFNIAEAIVRGWLTGNAEDYYNQGVKAAMEFVAAWTPDLPIYNHGRKITDEYIASYLSGPKVKFASTADKQMKQILQQKYLMRFMQYPWDAYYEYRRTGYPTLPINPNTNLNEQIDRMPVRWMYPQSEYDVNTDNLNAALQSQYGGKDQTNDLMWIMK